MKREAKLITVVFLVCLGVIFSILFFIQTTALEIIGSSCSSEGAYACQDGVKNVRMICFGGKWTFDRYCTYGGEYTWCACGECTQTPISESQPPCNGGDEPNIVEYQSPSVSASGQQITATVYLRNDGGDMTQNWLVELQPRLQTLSWVSPQQTCDPNNPQNVHREYRLNSGESVSFSLTSTISSGGSYNIYLVSADSCCPTNPNCQAVQPYGWETYVTTVNVCTNACEPGWSRCGGPGGNTLIQCGDDNGDGCYEWSAYNQQVCEYGCEYTDDHHAQCSSQPTTCTDSDGGLDYNTYGTVNYGGQTYSDVCIDSVTLKEYYCPTSTTMAWAAYTCPNGCSDGKCGTCTNACDPGWSRCGGPGGNTLIQCADDNGDGCYEWSAYNQQECQYGCEYIDDHHAQCSSQPTLCVDSDGGLNYQVQGSVSYGGQVYVDVCIDIQTLKEYYCQTTHTMAWAFVVCDQLQGATGCQNGVCTDSPTCTEGQKRCSGNNIEQCQSNNWILIQQCPYGCNPSTLICNPAQCTPQNCQAPFFECVLNSCMIDWDNVLLVLAVAAILTIGVAVIIRRRK